MKYLLELYLRDVGAGGSNPLTPTNHFLIAVSAHPDASARRPSRCELNDDLEQVARSKSKTCLAWSSHEASHRNGPHSARHAEAHC